MFEPVGGRRGCHWIAPPLSSNRALPLTGHSQGEGITMDEISKLYEEAAELRDQLERSIKDSQQAIAAERVKIDNARLKLARIPRAPIQRTKKAKLFITEHASEHPLDEMFQKMNADMASGKAMLTGKGTLTVTDQHGNDITDQVTGPAPSK